MNISKNLRSLGCRFSFFNPSRSLPLSVLYMSFASLLLLSGCSKGIPKIISLGLKPPAVTVNQGGHSVETIISDDGGRFQFDLKCTPAVSKLEISTDQGTTWSLLQDISCINGTAAVTFNPEAWPNGGLSLRTVEDWGTSESVDFSLSYGGHCRPTGIPSGPHNSLNYPFTISLASCSPEISSVQYGIGAWATTDCSSLQNYIDARGRVIPSSALDPLIRDSENKICLKYITQSGLVIPAKWATEAKLIQDTQAPNVTVDGGGVGAYINGIQASQLFAFSGTCDDSMATISLKIWEKNQPDNFQSYPGIVCSSDHTWSKAIGVGSFSEGLLSVQVTIRDLAQNERLSSTKEWMKDTSGPQISSVTTSKSNGQLFKAGDKIDIKVVWDQPVSIIKNSETGPLLKLNTSPIRNAALATGNNNAGSMETNFEYQVTAGDNAGHLNYDPGVQLNLNGATMRDAAGNAVNLDLPLSSPFSTANLGVDTEPPGLFDFGGVSGLATGADDESIDHYLTVKNGVSAIELNFGLALGASSYQAQIYDAATGGNLKCTVNGSGTTGKLILDTSNCNSIIGSLNDNQHFHVELKATDEAGNINLATNARAGQRYEWIVDSTIPGIGSIKVTSGSDTNGSDTYLKNLGLSDNDDPLSGQILVSFSQTNTNSAVVRIKDVDQGTLMCSSATLSGLNPSGNSAVLSNCALVSERDYIVVVEAHKASTDITNTVEYSFRTDWTPPTLALDASLTSTPINFSNKAAYHITGSCSEDNQLVTIYRDGSNSIGTTTCHVSSSPQIDFSVDASNSISWTEGDHQITASITDPAGNSATSTAVTVKKDTVAPIATLGSGAPLGEINWTNFNIQIAGTDVIAYKYKFGTGSSPNCATSGGAYSSRINLPTAITDIPTGYSDGSYYLCVIGRDVNGNWQIDTAATVTTWKRDTISPIAVIASGAPLDPSNAGTLAISVGGDGVTNYKYKIESGSTQTCSEAAGYTAEVGLGSSIGTPSNYIDGEYHLCVIGRDTAGNWQALSDATSMSWNKDTVAPIATIQSGAPASVSNATSLSIHVNGLDVTHYKYKIASGTTLTCSSSAGYGAETLVSTLIATPGTYGDGDYYLCLIGRDSAGNWQDYSSATTINWRKDTQAPNAIINAAGQPAAKSNDSTIAITIGGTDVTQYKYKIGHGATLTCLDSAGYSSAVDVGTPIGTPASYNDDDYHLCVIGGDAAGNWELESNAAHINWTKDTTDPHIVAVIPVTPNGYFNAGDSISFDLQWSEGVTLGNVGEAPPLLELALAPSGGQANYDAAHTIVSSNYTRFIYTVSAGQNNSDLQYTSIGALSFNGATVTDGAGNSISSATLPALGLPASLGGAAAYVVDTTAPTISIDSIPTEGVTYANFSSFNISGACSENGRTVGLFVDGNTTSSGSTTCNTSANPQFQILSVDASAWADKSDHSLVVKIEDAAHNAGESDSVTIHKDVTEPPPVLGALSMASTSLSLTSTPQMSWSLPLKADGVTLANISHYEFTIDPADLGQATWSSISTVSISGNTVSSTINGLALADQASPHTVYVRAVDTANHISLPQSAQWSSLKWDALAHQKLSAPITSSGFGQTLDISENGHYMVVGAPNANSGDGAIYFFTWNPSSKEWELKGNMDGDPGSASHLGAAVSISEKGTVTPKIRIVAGKPLQVPNGGFNVYHIDETTLSGGTATLSSVALPLTSLGFENSEGDSAHLGASVLALGDQIIVGSPDETSNCNDTTSASEVHCGRIYSYHWDSGNEGSYEPAQVLSMGTDGEGDSQFQFGIALTRDTHQRFWVGARNEMGANSKVVSGTVSGAGVASLGSTVLSLNTQKLSTTLRVGDHSTGSAPPVFVAYTTFDSATNPQSHVLIQSCDTISCSNLDSTTQIYSDATAVAIWQKTNNPTVIAIGKSSGIAPSVSIFVEPESPFAAELPLLRQSLTSSSQAPSNNGAATLFGAGLGFGADGQLAIGAPNFVSSGVAGALLSF